MKDLDLKKKILQEIMDEMDSSIGEKLKKKSPKFMKVQTNDPEMAEDVLDSALSKSEEMKEDESEEDKSNDEEISEEELEELKKLLLSKKG